MITVHHLEMSRSQRILWLLEELGVRDENGGEAAELRDTRARLLATLGNLDEAAEIAEDVAAEMAALGRTGDAAHAFWLAGRCRAQSDPEAAVALLESAVEGFTLVRGERSSRGAASDELVELLTALGREDDAAAVLSRLMAT